MSPTGLPVTDSRTAPAASARRPATSDVDINQVGLLRLSCLALLVGVVTGFGAVGFRDLIGLIHNVLFLGQFSWHYDANLFTRPRLGERG
jgi:chloride channel protein, CIC family